jgi:uncharacterized protein with beta-barrel porin domain
VRSLTQPAVSRRTSLRIIRTSLLCRTALATASLSIALVTAAVHPVLAGGGTGGDAHHGVPPGLVGIGGAGGADGLPGAPGTNAAAGSTSGGGGGGGGGAGGAPGGQGGLGDNSGGASGGDGGGGGAGGANGQSVSQADNVAPIVGGTGLTGGIGGNTNGGLGADGGGGGGGGSGGDALVVTGTAASSNGSTLTGGIGGTGGKGGDAPASGGNGGSGGDGGAGLKLGGPDVFTNTGTIQGGLGGFGGVGGNGGAGGDGGKGGAGGVGVLGAALQAVLINRGLIEGGNGNIGGAAGSGPVGVVGTVGTGGAGIAGAGLTVINSGTIAGGISGAGGIRANAITFTGGSNILELQAGSTITGNVVAFSAADTLRLGGTTNAGFDVSQIGAQYLGFGIFQKTGSSTWTLSGTNTAALPWTINAGTLMVDGTLANSPMTVNSGTLAGTGTVGNIAVANGGTFAPGSGAPGSTMAVSGSLAFQSGAFYLVQINPSTASFANVTGTATLAGTVQAVLTPGSYSLTTAYDILHATAGLGGTTFSGAGVPNFSARLSYTATDVFLTLNAELGAGSSLNRNQQSVANGISNAVNAVGTLAPGFANLFALTGANLATGLTQLSGETATGAQQTTFDAMSQFMGVMTDPFIAGRGNGVTAPAGALGYADDASHSSQSPHNANDALAAIYTKAPPLAPAFVPGWSVWGAGFGGSQSTSGTAAVGSSNTTSSIAGTAVGADYLISPATLAGFALAGGGTSFSVANGGSGRSDLFQAGAYLRHTEGPAYVSAALAYGWQDITTNRTVTAAGIDQLRAEFDANAYSGRVEGGYRFVAPWTGGVGITPYAAGQFTTFDLPSYAEQALSGAGTFALAYGAKDVTDTRSELGIRTDKSFLVQDGILTLRTRFGWAHDFDPDRSIAATFQALPGASFVVNGAAQASDSALTTASVEMKWKNGWSAAATFDGEFSNVTSSYAGKGVVRYAW